MPNDSWEIDPEEEEYVLLGGERIRRTPQRRQAAEYHIFKVDGRGYINYSQCSRFHVTKRQASDREKLKTPDMRIKAARIGRPVCGTCVSTLYGKIEDED